MIKLSRVVMNERQNSDYTTCATFKDLDGKTLSVAFEGRYNAKNYGTCGTFYEYGPFTDCIVIDENGKQHQMVSEIESLRVMRDSLNRMNLGD